MIFFLLNKDKKTRIITKHPKEKIINRGKTKSTQRLERRFLKETQENNNHITTDSFTSHLQLRGNRFVNNTHHHERDKKPLRSISCGQSTDQTHRTPPSRSTSVSHTHTHTKQNMFQYQGFFKKKRYNRFVFCLPVGKC